MIGRLGTAKRDIEAGRLRALGSARRGDQADATLIAGAARMAGLSNAVVLMCRHGRGAQSVSLVRAMVVTSLAMCWAVSAADMSEAVKQKTRELKAWRAEDETVQASDRLDLLGLTDSEAEAADAVLKRMDLTETGESPAAEEALFTANRAMAVARWALEERWPGAFASLPSPDAA